MTVGAQALYVGSYNVRNQNDSDTNDGNGWTQRCPVICSVLNYQLPDIFGVQEALVGQMKDLTSGLNGYAYIGVGRDDGKESGEYAAIFYRTSKVRLLDKNNFWLSETPDVVSKGWDAKHIRICSWGKFQLIESGKVFYFFNLHMDHVGTTARRESAKLVVQKIKEYAGDDAAVILTGDFNVDQKNEIYNIFTDSGILRDSYMAARQRYAENGTCTGWSVNNVTDSRIDHLFVSNSFDIERYGILGTCYWRKESNGNYTCRMNSDHYPVFARLNFKQDETTATEKPVVRVKMSQSYAKAGQEIVLTATASGNPTTWKWTIPGDVELTSDAGSVYTNSIRIKCWQAGQADISVAAGNSIGTGHSVASIDIYDDAEYNRVGNIALHKRVDCFSGSTNYQETPGNMLDGVTNPSIIYEKWCNISSNSWSVIDLMDTYRIYGFAIHDCKDGPEKSDPNFSNYKISVSNDGLHWTEVVNETGRGGDNVKTDYISPVTARYVKLNPWNDGQMTLRIWEFEVFGYDIRPYIQTTPLTIKNGLNADLVAESKTSAAHTNNSLDGKGWVFYANSLQRSGALPDDGVLFSAQGTPFQLASYTGNNAATLHANNESTTLELAEACYTDSLYILSTSANGESTLGVTVNYDDGTQQNTSFNIYDWYSPSASSDEAFYGLGRIITADRDKFSADDTDNRKNFRLFENVVKTDETRKIVSVTLTNCSSGSMPTVMALSGRILNMDILSGIGNPARDSLDSRLAISRSIVSNGESILLKADGMSRVSIVSAQGKFFKQIQAQGNETTLHIDHLVPGLYIVSAQTTRGIKSAKIIVR